MFVNKVLESQKLQMVVYKRLITSPIFVKDPFSKAEVSFVKFKHYPNKLITGEKYKNDLLEKKIHKYSDWYEKYKRSVCC